jgi:hypothetical protein
MKDSGISNKKLNLTVHQKQIKEFLFLPQNAHVPDTNLEYLSVFVQ